MLNQTYWKNYDKSVDTNKARDLGKIVITQVRGSIKR